MLPVYVLPVTPTGALLGSFAPILPIGKLQEMMVCSRQEVMEKACLEPTCDLKDLLLEVNTREIAALSDLRGSLDAVLQQRPVQQPCPSSVLRSLRCEALQRSKGRSLQAESQFPHLTRYKRLHSFWKDYCRRESVHASELLTSREGRKYCALTTNGDFSVQGQGKTWAHARSQAIWKALNRLAPGLLQAFSQSY